MEIPKFGPVPVQLTVDGVVHTAKIAHYDTATKLWGKIPGVDDFNLRTVLNGLDRVLGRMRLPIAGTFRIRGDVSICDFALPGVFLPPEGVGCELEDRVDDENVDGEGVDDEGLTTSNNTSLRGFCFARAE